MNKILIIGACGQLGTELTLKLRELRGKENVIASDIKKPIALLSDGPFEQLDIFNKDHFRKLLKVHHVDQVYNLASILSAKGERNPKHTWKLNIDSLLTVLEAGRGQAKKIYWPSSIAVFGPNTPKKNTPQHTIMDPNTIYGISKLAGERWCEYYFQKYNVDVRSLRYPGLIGYKALPGGGTTDYAVDIFHKAIKNEPFECFLCADTMLPMMYMDDAVKAAINLMEADKDKIGIRSSYNLSAMSFTPKQIVKEIQKTYSEFKVKYKPDFRQKIADSWPQSVDDSIARADWGWNHDYAFPNLVKTMIVNLKKAKGF